MCGIAGFFSEVLTPEEGREALGRMLMMISHRGPDSAGIYSRCGWFQGHVRLSILDLERGHQPMKTASGRHVISFNGEIFNYRELRTALEMEGCRFRTTSDTEVIVEGFERHGSDFIRRLNGQFAFAIYSRCDRRIYLARDRFGIRPLFWQKSGKTFIFASEIKAIFAHPHSIRSIDYEGIDQAITFWGTLPPRTCFTEVSQLAPGEVMVVDLLDMSVQSFRFWTHGALLDLPKSALSVSEYREGLVDVLTRSVRRQMISDVPVGCYLSGGIDSSIISTLAHQDKADIKLFSVSFEDDQFDESYYQKLVVDKLQANHLPLNINYSDIAENFEHVVWHAESLLFRTAPVPLYLLSKLVREQGVKVVLTGEGSDEVLWGYDTFKEQKVRMFWGKNPESLVRPRLLSKIFPYVAHFNEQNYEMLRMYYQDSLGYSDDILYSHSIRFANNKGLKRYFSSDIKKKVDYANSERQLYSALPENIRDFNPLERNQILEFTTLLQGYLLSSQGDRMAMSHSVEGRFPFLDNEVVEYCFTLPGWLKMCGLREKNILKRAFASLIPKEVAFRAKQAYMAPDLKSFFNSKELDRTMALLSSENIRSAGIWDDNAVRKLVHKFSSVLPEQTGFRDNMAACAIISSQYLYDLFIANYPPLLSGISMQSAKWERDDD